MKKDLIFAPILLVIGVLLFLLKVTGMPAHIGIAVAGVLALAVYTAAARKEWKLPALEVAFRAFYGIALITGVVLMKVQEVPALGIAHKVCAALFVVLLVVTFAHKALTKKA